MPNATRTIYVAIVNATMPLLRPVLAAQRAGGLYLILSVNDDPESEPWQFSPGSLVRCELRQLAEGERLVAVEQVLPATLRLVGGQDPS